MAVQRRVNFLSQQRVDVPDMRSLESAASNDFDQLIQGWVTGTTQGYIVRGFNILIANAIGNAASSLQMQVDPGSILHIAASQSGTFLMVPAGTLAQQLNAAINTNVSGAFTPSSVNYVSIDYIRFIDDTTSAQVYIWNPTSNTETTKNAPRAQILQYVINISTSTPTANLLPIAIVTTDSGNNVTQITDARWLFCRLGTGGLTPNPLYIYPWSQGRAENPSTSTSNSSDPFTGGDKNIGSLKEWMNAIMTSLKEVKGTTYWYSVGSAGSLEKLREDLANTVITGSGDISHGIIPNSLPILITTGNITTGSDQLTSLASVAGLANGQYVVATGIPSGTTIINIVGSTVTLSQNATLNGTGISVSFFSPSVITAPGQINWDKPISIRVIGSSLKYTLSANASSTDITLLDDYAAYIVLVRGVAISPNLIFTNGSQTVTSVGAIAWTASLQAGDFVKLASDSDVSYYEILTVDSASQVTLVNAFAGISTGAGGAQSQYAFGSYIHSPAPIGNPRAIQISQRALVPEDENVFWLFLREDNLGNPRVYIRFLGVELSNGEDRDISGTIAAELLKYVGSPLVSASRPLYVSALNPGSLEEIQLFTFGTAAQTPQSSYFLINSSGDARRYYVWFNKDSLGVDPNPGLGTNTSIEVSITTGMTASQIAVAVTTALNVTFYDDFNAVHQVTPSQVLVTNSSAGTSTMASDGNVGAPFAIVENQAGTGTGNFIVKDGDNLTLAIKELDRAIGAIFIAIDSPSYDEPIDIVVSGATPPTSLNGPVAINSIITLPLNTRLFNAVQKYTVGKGSLQVFLNGQYLRLGDDWLEVGVSGSLSNQFQILSQLEVGDSIELRMSNNGGGGAGGNPGPVGPPGPPGSDAIGGPIAISTKSSNYTVLLTDNVLKANCAGGSVTFFLPTAAAGVGRVFWFKKIDVTANQMILQANGVEVIDNLNTQATSTQYESFVIISDGTSWGIY